MFANQKEYYENNAEYRVKRRQQWIDYANKNKASRALRASERITCLCGSIYARAGTIQHKRTLKHKTFLSTQ